MGMTDEESMMDMRNTQLDRTDVRTFPRQAYQDCDIPGKVTVGALPQDILQDGDVIAAPDAKGIFRILNRGHEGRWYLTSQRIQVGSQTRAVASRDLIQSGDLRRADRVLLPMDGDWRDVIVRYPLILYLAIERWIGYPNRLPEGCTSLQEAYSHTYEQVQHNIEPISKPRIQSIREAW
jgi:hypothetical protein